MELLIFGHAGPPAIVFPTSMGRFFEFEDRGLVSGLASTIDRGHLQLVCVDSVDDESWYHSTAHPHQRIQRHLQYEAYLLAEVLPLARSRMRHTDDDRVIAMGCSLGAFHAALLAFRHPDVICRVLAFSGKYDNSTFLNGYSDADAYLTNPLAFLPGLRDEALLGSIRSMDIVIVTGSTDPHVDEARQLAAVLWENGVANTLDVWDGWMHDWPYWQAMARKYL